MTATWRTLLLSGAGTLLVAAATPASVSAAAETAATGAATPILSYDLASYAPAGAPAGTQPADSAAPTQAAIDQRSLDCMAKVVHHESRGQPRRGMIAVAQTLVNRMKAGGRFGGSICEVANQRGQFFDTASYHPREDSADYQAAVDVSRATLSGAAEPAAPGALFFHAAYRAPGGFFRGRQRVAAIGGQVFYR